MCVCVLGDAGAGGVRGMQRETAGPIIDGALLGSLHPQSLASPSASSLLGLIKWLHFSFLFSARAPLIRCLTALKSWKETLRG